MKIDIIMFKMFRKILNLFDSRGFEDKILQNRLVYFADGEAPSAAPDAKESQPFNLVLSEEAKRRMSKAGAAIVKVKKDEGQYKSSGAIVKDLKAQLVALGFEIPEEIEFKTIDDVIDYLLENTDFSFQPLRLGDIHIDKDSTRLFRNMNIEFKFDEQSQKLEFEVPKNVQFFDLDGNKTSILPTSDATHIIDVVISYDDGADTFVIIMGKDDDTQIKRTLKYRIDGRPIKANA